MVSDRHRQVGGVSDPEGRGGKARGRSDRRESAPGVATPPAHGLDREQHLLTIRTPRTTSSEIAVALWSSRTLPPKTGAPDFYGPHPVERFYDYYSFPFSIGASDRAPIELDCQLFPNERLLPITGRKPSKERENEAICITTRTRVPALHCGFCAVLRRINFWKDSADIDRQGVREMR